MINPRLLPTVMIILSVLASLVYLMGKDYRHAIYWLASAALVSAVTY